MDKPDKSELTEPIQRWLSSCTSSAFKHNRVSAKALVQHFGIQSLIIALSAKVRGLVFCACNGGGEPERAAKIDAESVALLLSSMLKSGIVNEMLILKEISFDHMVEVLPNEKLYALVFGNEEKRLWENGNAGSKAFMAEALEVLLEEALLSPETYVSTLKEEMLIHTETPPELLIAAQRLALAMNREDKRFTDANLIGIYTPEKLVEYVELTDLFPAIEAVARAEGWIEAKAEEPTHEIAATGIPSEALDSVLPDPIEEDDGPEIEIGATNSDSLSADDAAMVLEVENLEEEDEMVLEDMEDGETGAVNAPEDEAKLALEDESDSPKKAATPPPLKGRNKKVKADPE